jgi:hypothetical protein
MWQRAFLLGVVSLCALACGDDAGSGNSGNEQPEPPQCVSGTSYSCFNPRDNCQGRQQCVNGMRTACQCDGSMTPGPSSEPDASLGDASMPGDDPDPNPRDSGSPPSGSGGMPPDDPDPPPPEDCGNGSDDDEDGEADCADDDCSTRACAEAAPAGWTGPSVLYVGTDPSPSCGGGFATEALFGGTGVTAPAATCSTCTCSASGSGCATYLNLSASTQNDCGGTTCGASVNASCTEVSVPCLGSGSGYVTASLPAGAPSCSPSTQTPNVTAASFAQRVRACAPSSTLVRGGCDSDEVCAPAAPFTGPLCIVQAGDHACPSGGYSQRSLAYTSIDDTRSCSACSCDKDCLYEYRLYDAAADLTCSNAPLVDENAGTGCPLVTPSAGKVRVGVSMTGTGACSASGGSPMGSALASGPVTVCCAP